MRIIKLLLFVLFPSVLLAQESYLDITISNIKNNEGKLIIIIDDNKKSYKTETEKDAFFMASIKSKKDSMDLRIPVVGNRLYSIFVFHDENLNSNLDTNFLGIPSEGLSMSKVKKVEKEYEFEEVSVKPNTKQILHLAY